jgi:hypothetical protein
MPQSLLLLLLCLGMSLCAQALTLCSHPCAGDANSKVFFFALLLLLLLLPLAGPCRWNEAYIEAKLSMEDRAAKLEAVAELVEKDLVLLGCTAIEDKLQEGVPHTIKTLAEAGIRLWVLTGDKMVRQRREGLVCRLKMLGYFYISSQLLRQPEVL